jgi:recombination protein RecR
MIISSGLLENAVNELAKLPGIGRKTAVRLALHLLKQDTEKVGAFTESLNRLRTEIKFCQQCHNIADEDICAICTNTYRNAEQVCVVENIRDVMAIETTQQYNGVYHVLGGVISPIDGIGPDQINVATLEARAAKGSITEIIMAISPTMAGDTTIFYISQQLKKYNITLTTIARGIAFGGELEYADELTLARSISNRQPILPYKD